jgi:hypothetical protein
MKEWQNINECYLHHLVKVDKVDGSEHIGYISDTQQGIIRFFYDRDRVKYNKGDKSVLKDFQISDIQNIECLRKDD